MHDQDDPFNTSDSHGNRDLLSIFKVSKVSTDMLVELYPLTFGPPQINGSNEHLPDHEYVSFYNHVLIYILLKNSGQDNYRFFKVPLPLHSGALA